MLRTHLLSLLLLFNTLVMSQSIVDSSRIVKVMTFNILHGATTLNDYNLDRIAQVINESNPDLVALQEVDFRTKRALNYDLVTELGWRTKMAPLFGKAMDYDGGEYGEGILSKYSYVKSRNIALPHSQGNEPRTALEVTTILPSDDTITFIGTHLEHSDDETDRISQAETLVDVFSANKYPTILSGDLNALPASAPIDILESHWTSTYDKINPLGTYPSLVPTKKIDYIMYHPKQRWRIIERFIIEDSIASDHCAYMVILELLPQ